MDADSERELDKDVLAVLDNDVDAVADKDAVAVTEDAALIDVEYVEETLPDVVELIDTDDAAVTEPVDDSDTDAV